MFGLSRTFPFGQLSGVKLMIKSVPTSVSWLLVV